MTRLSLVAVAAVVAVLAAAPMVAYAADGPAGAKRERKGDGVGRPEGRPDGPKADLQLTDEQKALLAPAIKDFEAAMAAFQEEVTKIVGEKMARLVMVQTVARIMRSSAPREDGKPGAGPEGERRREREGKRAAGDTPRK